MSTPKGTCAYCKNKEQCNKYRTLDNNLYNLFNEKQYYARNALFCIVCIARATRKLKRREKTEAVILTHSNGSEHTYESIQEIRERLRSHQRANRSGG